MSLLRKLLTIIGGSGAGRIVLPSASTYIGDLIGKIDLREYGGYFNHTGGTGGLYIDPPPSQQGGYFNRQ